MHIKKISITAITLIALIALGSVGVVYGLWSEKLAVDGTVYTGNLYAQWTECACMDGGVDPTQLQGVIRKDVANTICTIDQQDPRIMHVSVVNGYPSYYNDCEVEFSNYGSIPIKIFGYKVIPIDYQPASTSLSEDGELWVSYVDGIGTQMEPCPNDSCQAASSLKMHVAQLAKENYTYNFDVFVCVAQWNEYEPGMLAECLTAAGQ